jgi:hypothetical protein
VSVSLEQLIYQGLVADAAFKALLGTDSGGNPAFYDKKLPQQLLQSGGPQVLNVSPAGVYQRISSPRKFAHGAGVAQANTGLARFQLTFWSNAATGTAILDEIDRAVKSFFQSFVSMYAPGSPAFSNPSFTSYDSRTGVEPQTQPPLQKLIIDVQFWFSDQ